MFFFKYVALTIDKDTIKFKSFLLKSNSFELENVCSSS